MIKISLGHRYNNEQMLKILIQLKIVQQLKMKKKKERGETI